MPTDTAAPDAPPVDLLIVGGGVNGTGIARDTAGRGVSVTLAEMGDLAGATSSASSRLVHGGLRYLEHFEFSLVRESCLERALLLDNAAGYVWPESFVFPVRKGDRVGRLKMGAGLWLYTALSLPRALGLPSVLSRDSVAARVPGMDRAGLKGGGAYLDGATDDARLTLAIAKSAAQAGAQTLTRAEVRSIEQNGSGAEIGFTDQLSGAAHTLRARSVILAGGPFTEALRDRASLGGAWISPTRGSHIVIPRDRLPTEGAVILPSSVDGRAMFFIPWARFTIVGTTDLDADASEPVHATAEEVDYLLESANSLVPGARATRDAVQSTWAGLRPLLAADSTSPSARSREERVERDGVIFTIAGGKLTGYRAMAEKLAQRVVEAVGRGERARKSLTRRTRLFRALGQRVQEPAWVRTAGAAPGPLAREHAWTKRYGALAAEVAQACREVSDGERALGAETLLGEVDWAIAREDCLSAVDFFLRRTDLGFDGEGRAAGIRELVVQRMAAGLGWSATEATEARSELDGALDAAMAWRGKSV